MNLNKAHLIGRVTRDPELRQTTSGASVASFGLATNYTYKNKAGEKIENVSFHNCVIWGKGAEVFSAYVQKGQEVYVAGRIEYQEWEKKEGGKGQKTVIVVDDFQFGAKAKGTAERQSPTSPEAAPEPEQVADDGEVKIEDIAF